ncbi:hypothetical protein OG530_36220 [Streptomyces decoyicus]|uniref:hypothetical protein n=1 Tax=Streptomyces decoyicus TaxID=249567 RepID=UPI002E19599B
MLSFDGVLRAEGESPAAREVELPTRPYRAADRDQHEQPPDADQCVSAGRTHPYVDAPPPLGFLVKILDVRPCPARIAAAHRNAVRGEPYGGSAELDQNLIRRPGPSSSRPRAAVPGLWHTDASCDRSAARARGCANGHPGSGAYGRYRPV